ncbi:MAG: hypothetical protein ACQKBY_12895 [Verrucomicrobiales bacterium]
MKAMKFIMLGAVSAVLLPSCAETTGNPREGGLFGWSREKAEWRLQDRRDAEAQINADTRRVEAENRRLRYQRDQLR